MDILIASNVFYDDAFFALFSLVSVSVTRYHHSDMIRYKTFFEKIRSDI
jgi:hypothetical protein